MDFALVGFLTMVAFVVVALVALIERLPDEARAGKGWLARHPRRFAAAWLLGAAAPTLAGLLAPVGPIPPPVFMAPILVAAVWFGLSRLGGHLAAATPIVVLTGFQAFRFPLELVLHEWSQTGLVPPQMTWTGANIDIVAGLVALVTIPVVRRWPRAGWIPTVVGTVLLANVIRVVVTSFPGPLQRFPEPILLPTMFPHVWIATVCVAGAVAVHVLAWRALLGSHEEALEGSAPGS